ncbi:3503_t:CDS:1, partial [Acaulospora morrowiae]
MAQFCKRELLSDSIVIGVKLRRTQLLDQFDRALTLQRPMPLKAFPKNLEAAWNNEFQRTGSGDVKITIQEQTIYASSAILAKRSDYFQRMFEGSWAECNRSCNNQQQITDDSSINDSDDCLLTA